MTRYLIINADDFGMCHAANAAVMDLFQRGCISSATVMPVCPWLPEAGTFARTHPEFAIGVHLSFTSEWLAYRWRPVAREGVDSLVDDAGFLPDAPLTVEQKARPEDVEREIRAQVALTQTCGIQPSHLDNHQGSLYGFYGIQSLLPVVFKVCAEMGYPFRLMTRWLPGDALGEMVSPPARAAAAQLGKLAASLGVPILDCLLAHPYEKLPGETYTSFRDSICAKFDMLPDGIHEIFFHPAVDSPELRAIVTEWEKRVWEYQLLQDPVLHESISRAAVQVISWREVRRLRETLPSVLPR
jgi:chitin disaccharide deacetylase